MQKKGFLITDLVLNSLGIVLILIALIYASIFQESVAGPMLFLFFTNDSGIFLGVTFLLCAICNILSLVKKRVIFPAPVAYFKFVAVALDMITFLVVLCYLGPTSGFDFMYDFPDFTVLHLVGPLLGFVSFCVFESFYKIKWRYTFLIEAPLIVYSAVVIILVATGVAPAPYPFLDVTHMEPLEMVLIFAGFIVGAWIISFLVWLLQKVCRLIFYGYNIVEEVETANTEEPTTDTKNNTETVDKYKVRTYHVSRHHYVGQWQVKLATGDKAIKLFPTQAEAISYAKQLVKNNGGSIRVHSVKGRMRKE